MRRGPRVTFVIATIVSAAIAASLPAVAVHAAEVTVKVFRPPTAGTPVTCRAGTPSGALQVTLPACGSIAITPRPGATTAAQVAALVGASSNQVVIRNALIKNNGALARVVIEGSHEFTLASTVDVNFNSRSYGIGLNASFSRKNANGVTILAAGDSIVKRGFYAYFTQANGSSIWVEDQVGAGPPIPAPLPNPFPGIPQGVAVSYSVPGSGSTTQNTIPVPAPSAKEPATGLTRKCVDLVPLIEGTCVPNKERLGTVIEITLALNDQVTIPNGDHTFVAETEAERDAIAAALSPQAVLHQNTRNARVNPNDSGHLSVHLLGNESFHVENVNQTSLLFGPGGAIPVSVQLKDINKDGFNDLDIKVHQPDTGIECGDTTATLTGLVGFAGVGNVEFNATVGFYTGPGCP